MIEIPVNTPLGKKINTIGVWMSGGADSALLTYMLAEKIKKENLSVKILPLTVDYKRPFQKIAEEVKNFIVSDLNCPDIFLEHQLYHPKDNEDWVNPRLAEIFHEKNYELFKNQKVDCLFSAITTTPPLDVQENFKWGILEDIENKRGPLSERSEVRYFVREENNKKYEFLEFKPFYKINKQEIYKIYKDKQLLDTLFPITRSCEKLGTVRGHCGDCWWCEERKWAFGKL